MSCQCCSPVALSQCLQCVPEPIESPVHAHIHLTVCLLSGAPLAKLTVQRSLTIAELKEHVAKKAKLPEGRVVRWLSCQGENLADSASLEALRLPDCEELVAICTDAIVGEFEKFREGCPTCEYGAEMVRLSFNADGLVSIMMELHGASNIFRYSLGEPLDGAGGTERLLELTRLSLPSDDNTRDASEEEAKTYVGVVYIDAKDATHRKVKIPEMGIDVQDLRFLKQMGLDMMQRRLDIAAEYEYVMSGAYAGDVLEERLLGDLYEDCVQTKIDSSRSRYGHRCNRHKQASLKRDRQADNVRAKKVESALRRSRTARACQTRLRERMAHWQYVAH